MKGPYYASIIAFLLYTGQLCNRMFISIAMHCCPKSLKHSITITYT